MTKSSEKNTSEAADLEPTDATAEAADEATDEDTERVEEPESNRYQVLLLAAAFLTAILFLIMVNANRSWDPYVCESDEDCRGTKECIENYCHNPEVYQRQQDSRSTE